MSSRDELKALQLRQIDSALDCARKAGGVSHYRDPSNGDTRAVAKAYAAIRSAIGQVGGEVSGYAKQLNEALESYGSDDSTALPLAVGALEALREAVESDFLQSTSELIHGNLFSEYLDMAGHLLDEGYKDPAAVLAGSTLESHLRQLCAKAGVATDTQTSSGSRPKRADQMNADLVKQAVYSGLDQKNVTAWLDLRNKAAHGKYGEYTGDQVALLIQSVRDFITRNPA